MTYFGAQILATGEGQCRDCGQKVMRILVPQVDKRVWLTVMPEAHGYVAHSCAMSKRPEAA